MSGEMVQRRAPVLEVETGANTVVEAIESSKPY